MKKDIVKKAVSIFTSIFLCFSVVFSITTQAFSAEVNVISSESDQNSVPRITVVTEDGNGCIVLSTVFIMNIIKTVEMSVSQYKQNTIEQTYAQLYMNEINKYEAESGAQIKNIELCTDQKSDLVSGEKALTEKYAFEPLMEYVSGREFKVKNMSENTRTQKFNKKDWKTYSASEQLIFENDTMYLCVY